jgi:diaminopimelate epimerase
MEFTKMQGNGNDFIVIDNREGLWSKADLSRLAVRLCLRRQSVGADGLIAVEKSPDADFTMRLFNSDGSEAEMCGNGARCAARYACEKEIAPPGMVFSTPAGPVRAEVRENSVSLEMGSVDLQAVMKKKSFPFAKETIFFTHLVVGVPHTVVFPECVQGKARADLRRLAEAMQGDRKRFPSGTNVNFVTAVGERLKVQTFERGVGDFTLSCGTGSAASAIALWLETLTKSPVAVENPGGTNIVVFPDDRSLEKLPVTLTGGAEFVYQGRIADPGPSG